MGRTEKYAESELELMTTHQLRELCRREKIMNGVIDPLDKEELIWTIVRHMGKRQARLVREHAAGGIERLEAYLNKVKINYQTDNKLYCQSQILAYEGLSIEYYDSYTIPYRTELAGTNALLVGSGMALCGILNIEQHGQDMERLYITKAAGLPVQETQQKDYRIFCAGRRISDIMFSLYYGEDIVLPQHIEVYSIALIDFAVQKPVNLALPMAIDFGAVSTTAGVYLDAAYFRQMGQQAAIKHCRENEICYTTFENGMDESIQLPSVIGVLAVEDADYKLAFGYDAMRLATASYIDEGFCVFYDVKRWISACDREEEIADRQGRRRMVKRADILRRFFLYIIQKTQNRFKCHISQVHISSTVRQKCHFEQMIDRVLPDYRCAQDMVLDEGMAVLYDTISDMRDRGKLEENESYEALLVNCGGTTTDLCSYRFRFQNRKAAYKIEMEAAYENGDINFGGNNLTYRMMQMLKIALVHAQESGSVHSVKEILQNMDTDVYRDIDACGIGEFYQYLDREYQKAEEILPTRYADFGRYNRREYYKVKNNFYTLFGAAEQIKQCFYGPGRALQVRVSSKPSGECAETVVLDKWKLSFREGDTLVVKKLIPDIVISCSEAELLVSGEIYDIMRRFMEDLYQSGRMHDFSLIKLTGQSCRIERFRDALKEFVPGRQIQFRRRSGQGGVDAELKTACVSGALKYMRDKKYGLADIHIKDKKGVIPYLLTAYTHNNKEVVLVDGFGDWDQARTVSRNMEDLILPLYLKDTEGREYFCFQYQCKRSGFTRKSYQEIEMLYGTHIFQKDTDSIENGDVKFFVWAEQENWGFWVVPVHCDADELYLGDAEFFGFENDGWVNSFFDGKK